MKQHLGFHGRKAVRLARRVPNAALAVVEFTDPDPESAETLPALQDGGLDLRSEVACAKREFHDSGITTRRLASDTENGNRSTPVFAKPLGIDKSRIGGRAVGYAGSTGVAFHRLQAGCVVQLLDEGVAKNAAGECDPYLASCWHAPRVAHGLAQVNDARLGT